MLQAARRFSTAVGTSSNPMLLAARRFSTAVIKNLGVVVVVVEEEKEKAEEVWRKVWPVLWSKKCGRCWAET
ncbi:hypothetical protein HPB50_020349 [Hyalomma asiaticum]|uniref:Uncharacterized protein n=1 Tax=Hyalomma asiaticum TaxID=266040 RepID=A0ACB7SPM6_HYAAI|nr:hypothetical protein HPB50_020349 [Hyalomma asiaticum]